MRALKPAGIADGRLLLGRLGRQGRRRRNLAAGAYTLVATATTSTGTVQRSAAVQIVAPVLGATSVSPASFYGGFGSTSATYALTASATVSVTVRDDSGATVSKLRDGVAQAAGSYSVTWDGKAADGSSVGAGSYTVVIAATGPAGTQQRSLAVQVVAPVLGSVSAAPAAFYAGSGSTTFSYTLVAAATTSVVVADGSGATVRTLKAAGSQTAGSYSVAWDGKADGGADLAAGAYTLVATATTSTGTVQRSATVQIVAPVLGATSVSPSSFYGGAGSSGATTLNYVLTGSAQVSVIARDASGAKVAARPGVHIADGRLVLHRVERRRRHRREPADGRLHARGPGDDRRRRGALLRGGPVHADAGGQRGRPGAQRERRVRAAHRRRELERDAQRADRGRLLLRRQGAAVGVRGDVRFHGHAVRRLEPGRSGRHHGRWQRQRRHRRLGRQGPHVPGVGHVVVSHVLQPPGELWREHPPVSGRRPLPGAPADRRERPRPVRLHVGHPDVTRGHRRAGPAASAMTGPYAAIPNLSLSLGWSKVLSGLKSETGANLVLFGGDSVQRAGDAVAPDDGATQWRQLLDNGQGFTSGHEWSLASLASTVPVQLAAGNHDDLGVGDATTAAANRVINNRWEYRPAQTDSDRGYYTFDQGDVHFIVMNPFLTTATAQYNGWIGLQSLTVGGTRSGTYSPSTTFTNTRQGDWLINAVQTTKPWTVVIARSPVFDAQNSAPWSQASQTGAATSTNDIYYGERDRMLKLFAAKGVDLVLAGAPAHVPAPRREGAGPGRNHDVRHDVHHRRPRRGRPDRRHRVRVRRLDRLGRPDAVQRRVRHR